jgi:hypothetical protein
MNNALCVLVKCAVVAILVIAQSNNLNSLRRSSK